jgi:uncharacterized protein (TIGR00369 family)
MSTIIDLKDDNGCFACGKSNPIGLKLEFSVEDDEYVTYFNPRKEHQGWADIVHGGIISTILDEVMARYVYKLGHLAVTGEINIRLKKPARVGERLRFAGKVESVDRRIIRTSARATDSEGTLVAEAAAKMVIVGDRQ